MPAHHPGHRPAPAVEHDCSQCRRRASQASHAKAATARRSAILRRRPRGGQIGHALGSIKRRLPRAGRPRSTFGFAPAAPTSSSVFEGSCSAAARGCGSKSPGGARFASTKQAHVEARRKRGVRVSRVSVGSQGVDPRRRSTCCCAPSHPATSSCLGDGNEFCRDLFRIYEDRVRDIFVRGRGDCFVGTQYGHQRRIVGCRDRPRRRIESVLFPS